MSDPIQITAPGEIPVGDPAARIDRPWSEYPIGTIAEAIAGGHWTKTNHGWKWCSGSTFPTPGGDAYAVRLPRGSAETHG